MTAASPPPQAQAQQHTEQTCRKCGGAMKEGIAMAQTTYTGDEGTCSFAGPGALQSCLKCSACGWSVTAAVAALPGEALTDERIVEIARECDSEACDDSQTTAFARNV